MHSSRYEHCHLHEGEYLQIVCLECTHQCLACPLCIDSHHNNHNMISLKKFITEQIPKLCVQPLHTQTIREKLFKLNDSFKHDFEKMRKSVGSTINQLSSSFEQEIERLVSELAVIAGEGNHIYTLENIVTVKKKIDDQLKIDAMDTLLSKIHSIKKKMTLAINQTTNQISSIISSLTLLWQDAEGLLLNSKSISKFNFSDKYKHHNISLNKSKLQATNTIYDNSYHVVLAQPPLTPFSNQITFKVTQTNHKCVWLGICDQKRVKELNYTNCFKNGDGAYWIWQAGCQEAAQFFSNLPLQNPPLDWNFDIGDEVTVGIQFGEIQNLLFFQKNENIVKVVLKDRGYYYACVALGDQKQSVTILKKA